MRFTQPTSLYKSTITSNITSKRSATPTPLFRQVEKRDLKKKEEENRLLQDGLAICLLGYSLQTQAQSQAQAQDIQKREVTIEDVRETKKQKLDVEIQSQTHTHQKEEEEVERTSSLDNVTGKVRRRFEFDEMYDLAYEEEVRQQAVMAEVLPDAEMWRKWEKTEAPLRQGRGWYPTLDRHFLELLVISEIHCLSHPLSTSANPTQADRIHRHASRVRRVACERIGTERLHAYCERVKEAFEAYMMGGWQHHLVQRQHDDQEQDHCGGEGEGEEEGEVIDQGMVGHATGQGEMAGKIAMHGLGVEIEHDESLDESADQLEANVKVDEVDEIAEEEEETRGRSLERGEGSTKRLERAPSPSSGTTVVPLPPSGEERTPTTAFDGLLDIKSTSHAIVFRDDEDDLTELKDVQLDDTRSETANMSSESEDEDGAQSIQATFGSSMSIDSTATERSSFKSNGSSGMDIDLEERVTYSTLSSEADGP
nr:uncharacterized protein CI109_004576 [Kwoniella shandongensis]KAA5527041.1 hypothetical protein CI109_004576 [Kwoniella shandongensis]